MLGFLLPITSKFTVFARIEMKNSCCLAAVFLLAAWSSCVAQSPSKASANDVRGFTWSQTATGTHDSVSGWSSILDSSVRYDLNRVFGMELGVPYYMSHNGYDSTKGVRLNQNPPLVASYNSLGDAYLTLHFAAPGTWVGYKSTLTGTAPTGDTSSGISTGRATFDFNNHFDHAWGFFTPLVEFGIGDSSALVNKAVRRPYTTLGPLSHYKAGASFDFLRVFSFESSGYEDLPIGDQKVYSHVLRRSKTGSIVRVVNGEKRRFARVAVDTGQGILEDNGLTGALTIDLGRHMNLTGSYQRSLRQSGDTVVIGVSYTFGKRTPKSSAL
jgi:hypothetical protein